MRTRSVDVLNDADDMQRKMDWILFKEEQDARLWGGPELIKTDGEWGKYTIKWRPGDPLHDQWTKLLNGNYGVTREMVEVIEDEAEWEGLHYACQDCMVDWDQYETGECWVCGRDYGRRERIGPVFLGDYDINFSRQMLSYSPADVQMVTAMGEWEALGAVSDEGFTFERFDPEQELISYEVLNRVDRSVEYTLVVPRRAGRSILQRMVSEMFERYTARIEVMEEPETPGFTERQQVRRSLSSQRSYPGSEPITTQRRRRNL